MNDIWIICKFLIYVPVFLIGLLAVFPAMFLWFVSKILFGTAVFLLFSGLAHIAQFLGADRKQLDEIYKSYANIMESV